MFLVSPLRIGTVAGLLTACISLFIPNHYRSVARILPVESKGAGVLGNLSAAAAMIGVNLPGQDGSDANYADILASRWIRQELLKFPFTWHEKVWVFGRPKEHCGTLYEYLGSKNLDQALSEMGTVLTASRDAKSKILTVIVETRSPDLSAAVAERALGLLESFLMEKGRSRGGNKVLFAEARLAEARREAAEAEAAFLGFLEHNRNFQTSQEPVIRLQGATLEQTLKLRQQLVTTIALNREQALMEEKNDMPILNVMDRPATPEQKSGPSRLPLVVAAFLVASGVALAYQQRSRLKAILLTDPKLEEQS